MSPSDAREPFSLSHLSVTHRKSEKGINMSYLHTHTRYEMLYIRRGSVCIENNGTVFKAAPPCLILHRPFTLHRAYSDDMSVYDRFVVSFDAGFFNFFKSFIPGISLLAANNTMMLTYDDSVTEEIEGLFEKLFKAYRSAAAPRCICLLSLLLDTVCTNADSGCAYINSMKIPHVTGTMGYIGTHFGEDIRIDALAASFFVSRSKLTSDFKKYTGITIKQYLQLTRLNYAKSYLQAGSSISKTAQKCGFYDDSHFIATFRHVIGVTPGQYQAEENVSDFIDMKATGKRDAEQG